MVAERVAVVGAGPVGAALSLLLAEGLHRRTAAHTLERAVASAEPDVVGTRARTDAVLELLPEVRTDVEMFEEIWAA